MLAGNLGRNAGRDELLKEMRAEYRTHHVTGRVLISRLATYSDDPQVHSKWHAVMDLLVVQYHDALGDMTDEILWDNAGPGHSELSIVQLKRPAVVEDRYSEKLEAVLQMVNTRPIILERD